MIDTAKIRIKAGNGGDGSISFRREKYAARGGPNGGDGGRGGDVLMCARSGMHMLEEFRYNRIFSAENGKSGQKGNKSGKSGKDYLIDVPVGTEVNRINDDGSRSLIADLLESNKVVKLAKGGKGGRGNIKFASPDNRAPQLAESGEETEDIDLSLELRLIADVAVIGKPSVGKSTFLSRCSQARPEIGDYPFTTLSPVLGVIERRQGRFIMAEIPGLIEGAHSGAGLGDEFLRHMSRTRIILHVLDGTSSNIAKDYREVRHEMGQYDEHLLQKPEVVLVNKTDLPEVVEKRSLMEADTTWQDELLFVSAATGEGIEHVLDKAANLLEQELEPEAVQSSSVATLVPPTKSEGKILSKDEDTVVIESSRLERIIRRVDLNDWVVQAQLWREIKRMGMDRIMERAGIQPGMTVRIGNWALEWH